MDRLDTLLSSVYGGKVVRKDLLHQIKGGENVPSYVLEYLLGRYCASDDPEEIRLGIEAVKATLQSNYFRHDEANKAQSLVEQQGKHRFIPFVEKNYNFIELGPRGTGKSYIFSEMSPYCILISGGKASSANLFYNNARRQVGLVGHWDLVAFDEVGGMKVQDPDTIQIMKDYMANGRFSRGVTQVHADASMVFVGNLNQSVETLVQSAGTDLFQPLPKEFDLAVMDRLHCYLPGWEIPKTSKDLLTDHYGFVTDYLAEAFRVLRKENRFDALDGRFSFGSVPVHGGQGSREGIGWPACCAEQTAVR
jgi:predicted ATP-dependent Lon-type protease